MVATLRLHTRETVESALKLGYAALTSAPCWSIGPRLIEGHAPPAALALNWLPDFLTDRRDRIALLSWVRCQVKGESWAAFCREAEWSRSTEDKRCDRALARIACGLNGSLTMVKPASDA